MRNKSTLFYSVSQVKVLNEIYWQKGPVTFKLCKSLENSTGHRPGGQHYCRTLTVMVFQQICQYSELSGISAFTMLLVCRPVLVHMLVCLICNS